MTCIVGLIHRDTVYMGADSAGVDTDLLSSIVMKDPKVFIKDKFLIGYTSSFRMGQILHYAPEPPSIPDGMDTHEYMCTIFVDHIQSILKDKGFARVSDNVITGGTFLVGYAGRLFRIEDSFQVIENDHGFDSVGCGCDYAMGSLFTSLSSNFMTPDIRVEKALSAASLFSAAVRRPFTILNITHKEVG